MNRKDSKIFIHILGDVGRHGQIERQSDVSELESRAPSFHDLRTIQIDCSTNTLYPDFSHITSLSRTLTYIKDVILFILCEKGFKGSLDDIILRSSDKHLLQSEHKTLHEIFMNRKDSKIFVFILGEDAFQRQGKRQSSVPELKASVPLNSTDDEIGTSQSSSDLFCAMQQNSNDKKMTGVSKDENQEALKAVIKELKSEAIEKSTEMVTLQEKMKDMVETIFRIMVCETTTSNV